MPLHHNRVAPQGTQVTIDFAPPIYTPTDEGRHARRRVTIAPTIPSTVNAYQDAKRDYQQAKFFMAASSVGLGVSSALTVAGAAMAPFTLGVSVALAGVGLLVSVGFTACTALAYHHLRECRREFLLQSHINSHVSNNTNFTETNVSDEDFPPPWSAVAPPSNEPPPPPYTASDDLRVQNLE